MQTPLLQPWPSKLVSPDMIDAELRSDGERLLMPAETMALAASVACAPQVRIGSAAAEIVAYAAAHGCDAIVMGTRASFATTASVGSSALENS